MTDRDMIALLERLPKVLPARRSTFVRLKSEPDKRPRRVSGEAVPSVSLIVREWERFYLKFGVKLCLPDDCIPADPGGFGRVLVIAAGLTPSKAFGVCEAEFPCRCDEDFNLAVPTNERDPRDGAYAIRVRSGVEADAELAAYAANQVREGGLATETLLERFIHGLKVFTETGRHLDVRGATLCSGSRGSDGSVPRAAWLGGKFRVGGYFPQFAPKNLRPRLIVPS